MQQVAGHSRTRFRKPTLSTLRILQKINRVNNTRQIPYMTGIKTNFSWSPPRQILAGCLIPVCFYIIFQYFFFCKPGRKGGGGGLIPGDELLPVKHRIRVQMLSLPIFRWLRLFCYSHCVGWDIFPSSHTKRRSHNWRCLLFVLWLISLVIVHD